MNDETNALRAWLTRELPLWLTLGSGLMMLFIFTGAWLVVQDIKKLRGRRLTPSQAVDLRILYVKLQVRRVTGLFAGLGLGILWWFEWQINVIIIVVVVFFFVATLNLVGRARARVMDADR